VLLIDSNEIAAHPNRSPESCLSEVCLDDVTITENLSEESGQASEENRLFTSSQVARKKSSYSTNTAIVKELFTEGDDCKKLPKISCKESAVTKDVDVCLSAEHTIQSDNTRNNKDSSKQTHLTEELGLCIDLMASRIKELELEKERIKLDVIIALRERFESLTTGRVDPSDNLKTRPKMNGDKLQTGMLEKLNESVCEITLEEVEKVKQGEREKLFKVEESYQVQLQKLQKEVEGLNKEKCKLLTDLGEAKRAAGQLDEKQSKLDRFENRVAYLESLLQTVEKDSDKYKTQIARLEEDISNLQRENKSLRSSLSDAQHQLDVTRTTDTKMKEFYEREHEKLVDENRDLKDEISSLQTQLQACEQEKERLVNSKETDLSIIKHLEEKMKRQGNLLDTMSTDSSKYFELNLKLESKAAEYKQKLKKSVYGIECTQEESKRLREEKESIEEERAALKKSFNEAKRKESELQFKLKRMKAEFDQKEHEWTLQKERLEFRYNAKPVMTNGHNASYAVVSKTNNRWDESLGPVITSSMNNHKLGLTNTGVKINLSPRQNGNNSYEKRSGVGLGDFNTVSRVNGIELEESKRLADKFREPYSSPKSNAFTRDEKSFTRRSFAKPLPNNTITSRNLFADSESGFEESPVCDQVLPSKSWTNVNNNGMSDFTVADKREKYVRKIRDDMSIIPSGEGKYKGDDTK